MSAKPCTKAIPVFDATIDLNVGPEYRNAVEMARYLCSTCPVWRECLLENRDVEGVVAGLTRAERVRLTAPTARVTCGKPHGAMAHRRNDERPCDECRAAEAARSRRRKEAAA
jgi:hypothetical protein